MGSLSGVFNDGNRFEFQLDQITKSLGEWRITELANSFLTLPLIFRDPKKELFNILGELLRLAFIKNGPVRATDRVGIGPGDIGERIAEVGRNFYERGICCRTDTFQAG
jgi:hypothetical protein